MFSTRRARRLREQARKPIDQSVSSQTREDAIRDAINAGVPLHKIEAYLDWLEMVEGSATNVKNQSKPSG